MTPAATGGTARVRSHQPAPPSPPEEPTAEELLAVLHRTDPDGEEAARLRDRVLEHYRGHIGRELRRYRNRGVPHDDLLQVAMVGALKAMRGFDPSRGKPFVSYLLPTVAGEIKRHFRDNTWAVRAPRVHQERRGELHRFTAEFTQAHRRAPSTAEIAAHMGMDAAQAVEMLCACNAYSALSLDRSLDTEEGDEAPLASTLPSYDRGLALVVDREALKTALARLPERERRIVVLRFFGELTQAEIAERLEYSQVHISRLLNAALRRLRRQFDI